MKGALSYFYLGSGETSDLCCSTMLHTVYSMLCHNSSQVTTELNAACITETPQTNHRGTSLAQCCVVASCVTEVLVS